MKLINVLNFRCFEGYNATVLAYGQTGSGKTYSMGTGLDILGKPDEKGVIPRAVEHLFAGIAKRQQEANLAGLPPPEFKIDAQFLELYNEDVIDLLADEKTKHSSIKIREDAESGIYLMGATTRPVKSVEESLNCLKTGALSRTTGSTQMNSQSSRSHAIFTFHIKQQRVVPIFESNGSNGTDDMKENHPSGLKHEFETLTAKFHFVDLAGSERLKRTGATGDRAKEGISINSGLLALGNVISALGDKTKKAQHVPYRDSKLTRLLQDSLGGNSRTLMIACISPSDRDFMETLNTLRYANRAKNIKNRVVANQDKSSQVINQLRRQIQELQLELLEHKQGKRVVAEDGTEYVNDMCHENIMLQDEVNNLNARLKGLKETNAKLNARIVELLTEKESKRWIQCEEGANSDMAEIIHDYMKQIEDLRAQLIESEETCAQLRKQVMRQRLTMSPSIKPMAVSMSGHYDIRDVNHDEEPAEMVIEEAKKEVERLKKTRDECLNNRPKVQHSPALVAKKEGQAEVQDTNGNEMMQISEDHQPIDEDMNGAVGDINGITSNENSEDEDDEDEEEEEEEAKGQLDFQLYELQTEINTKEKLIIELEKSQRKMQNMKHQYEEKLTQLQQKIHEIQAERDRVLSQHTATAPGNKMSYEQTKEIKERYQQKLNNLQSEMKMLQAAKRKNDQALKQQMKSEAQIKQLKNEVQEMKRQKVKLCNCLKEETAKRREADVKYNKKIAQMSKADWQKELKIKTLETEKNRMKNLLKKKEDEANFLRKRVKPMSDKVAGRISKSNSTSLRQLPSNHEMNTTFLKPKQRIFSPRKAKQKWLSLEQAVNKMVISKQTVSAHESQLQRLFEQRDQLTTTLHKLHMKLEKLRKEGRPLDQIRHVNEEIDGVNENIKYINSEITSNQEIVVQLEEQRDEVEQLDLPTMISMAPPEEIKYVIQKFMAMTISKAMTAAQAEEEKKEFEHQYQKELETSQMQSQLLHHVLEKDQTFLDVPHGYCDDDMLEGSHYDRDIANPPAVKKSSSFLLNVEQIIEPPNNHSSLLDVSNSPYNSPTRTKGSKARRLTKTTQELLFETSLASSGSR